MTPKLLTTTQAAREVGMSSRTLARYALDGVLVPTATLPSGHRRWDVEDLRRQLNMLTEQRNEGP